MRTFYELLEVAPHAPADEIKRAFRREIAKYHPDKVQHLGKEFQDIAAAKAAELTRAYKTLTDPALRADYDAELAGGGAPEPAAAPGAPAASQSASEHPPPPSAPPPPTPSSPAQGGVFQQERDASTEFVRRASLVRFRASLDAEFGSYEQIEVRGFDFACAPKSSLFRRNPPRVAARVVPRVTGSVLAETWSLACRARELRGDVCVFLMGPALASAAELAGAIAEQRRKPMPPGLNLVIIPVSTADWGAHVPNDAPGVVKSLLTRVRSA